MDVYEIGCMSEKLSTNTYPGRGIVLGVTPDGKKSVAAYFIMGRSVNSRNRVFIQEHGHERAVRIFGSSHLKAVVILAPGDALGLRLALLEHDMPPVQCASILHALERMGSPLPCFARVEGRLCLVPSKQRPPYDGDLHDLMRELIHRLHGRVSLDTLVKEVPPAWHCLPESARKHCAQHADDVWQTAFAAYLLLKSGQSEEAQAEFTQSHRPMRAERAYMQLIRRSNTIHEVH